MWTTYIFETMTGALLAPVDIPSLSWTQTVSSCSLSTTKDKGVGKLDGSGLTIPWTALPAKTQEARNDLLAPYKRGLVLLWNGSPVIAGIIGTRTDTWEDTAFSLISPLDFLANRILVREDTFGKSWNNTTTDTIYFNNMSLRGIASEIGYLATNAKPSGFLPIDWQYRGEKGSSQRTYYGYNVANNGLKKLLTELSNVQNGPDIQFRPVLEDNRVKWVFYAGSEGNPYLNQTGSIPTLTWYDGAGTIEGLKVAHGSPVMRVYGTGSGQDEGTLCSLVQDMTLSERPQGYPLIETHTGSNDWSNAGLVTAHAQASLDAASRPLIQMTGEVYINDTGNSVTPSQVWTGQEVDLDLHGYPSMPNGVYRLRLMEMKGNLSDKIALTFDPIYDPWEK